MPKIMFTQEELEEIKCLRAVLERILRVMDEGLFVDYQMEKWGKIIKSRKKRKPKWEPERSVMKKVKSP